MLGFVLVTLFSGDDRAWTLRDATQEGRADVVALLIREGADPDYTTNRTVLHEAAALGHAAVVDTLLARGAAIDPVDSDGHSPLTLAVSNDHFDVARTLMAAGAVQNLPRQAGGALRWALHRSEVDLAMALLGAGADPNATGSMSGNTPLIEAATHDHPDAVRALIAAGADPNAARTDDEGNAPLHEAAGDGYAEVVRALLNAGADSNMPNGEGQTPLDLAESEEVRAILRAASATRPRR